MYEDNKLIENSGFVLWGHERLEYIIQDLKGLLQSLSHLRANKKEPIPTHEAHFPNKFTGGILCLLHQLYEEVFCVANGTVSLISCGIVTCLLHTHEQAFKSRNKILFFYFYIQR